MGNIQPPTSQNETIAPPPRALKWLIILMITFFVLLIGGALLGTYAFREWVPPRYQVVYSEQFPILKMLLPARPDADTVLPTPIPATSSVSIDDLLGLSSDEGDTDPNAGAVGESISTTEPTIAPPTATPMPTQAPPTPTPAPTEAEAANTSPVLTANTSSTLPMPPVQARNFGFQYVTQTWNNCGPANVTMSLSFYGWQQDQSYAESFLRGAREDKNVSPHEIVDFVNEQSDLNALYRIGGDLITLKRLIAAEFPVMVELGYAPEGNDWLGHYQTVVGYDDSAQALYVLDSYIPSDQGLPANYDEFDSDWQQFTRTFLVFYPPSREGEIMSILGDLATPEGAYQVALETAQREARENPENGFAWFNLGRAQTYLGQYEAAAAAFDQARQKNLPWRMSWYQFEPFRAYYETGRYSDVLALVRSNETTLGGGFVEETYYWAGRVYEAQGDAAQAAANYRRAIRQNPRFEQAQIALARVS